MSLAVNPYLQYRQNAVQGADRGDLTLMLYDGLVKFIKLAIISIEGNDIDGAHNALVRSQEIIAHLNETLDLSFDLSRNLSALYDFMARRLIESNLKKDGQTAGEVLDLAREMRDTWKQALQIVKNQGY